MDETTSRGRLSREIAHLQRRIAQMEAERNGFTNLLEHIGIGVGVIDESGRTVMSNQLWRQHIPEVVTTMELEPANRWEAFGRDGAAIPRTQWPGQRALRGQTVTGIDFRHMRDDGRDVWVRMSAAPLRMVRGNVVEAVCTVQEVDGLVRTEEALRRSQELLTDELLAARQLQETSEQTAAPGDVQPLVERILDAAVVIMRSDFASIQAMDDDGRSLRLLGLRGFSLATATLESEALSSTVASGEALRTGNRAMEVDVETAPSMAGTEDLARFREVGVRSYQTTPLRNRQGLVVGMLSTHWHEPHHPAAYDLASLDVLARQAADVIEHWRWEEEESRLSHTLEEERQLVLRLSAPILRVKEGLLLLPLIGVVDEQRAEAVRTALLETISTERACAVVIDSSAAAPLGQWSAGWLVETAQAAQLLGVSVVLTGISGRQARALMPYSASLDSIAIAVDLEEGLAMARRLIG